MVFIHVNKLHNDRFALTNFNPITKVDELIKMKPNNKSFVLIYMEGCDPCNAVRPEWKKLENVLSHLKYKNDIGIIDIEKDFLQQTKYLEQPNSFPTIRYITDQGNRIENYEDSNIKNKDRSVDSFVEWINTKLKEESKKNNKTNKKRTKFGGKKTKRYKGGRWSLKYKRSINCKKPKGFSQKQYCKYGRRK